MRQSWASAAGATLGRVIVVVEAVAGQARPPAGAPISVQLRDTTFQDVAHPVLAEARGRVNAEPGERLAALELDLPAAAPASVIAWAHVDVDDDGRVSSGDYVTTAAHAVTESDAGTPLRVTVRRV
jgi:hypothetical protein